MGYSLRHRVAKFLLTLIFIGFATFWFLLHIFPDFSYYADLFTDTYGLTAGIGGIIGLFVSRKWGGVKSLFGRTIFFFSLGLVLQFFGQLVYSYYFLYLQIEIPYPSLGDVGYFGSIPMYILGLISLSRSLGLSISKASMIEKALALFVSIGILALSYVLFLSGYEVDMTQPLTVFLDFGYPLGQAVYVCLALLTWMLSRKVLGGLMKNKILLILFALFSQYVADFSFLYMTSRGTWEAGNLSEFIYLFSYFLMGLTLIKLNEVVYAIRGN